MSQILNFGLPAPIDVQIVGRDPQNVAIARDLVRRIAAIPGAVDVRLQQVAALPRVRRRRRSLAGAAARLHRARTSPRACWCRSRVPRRSQPNYWLNLQTGVNYPVVVQTPQYRIDSVDALGNTPIALPGQPRPQLLTNLAVDRSATSRPA